MLDLQEIKEALAAATPGPWDYVEVVPGAHPQACLNSVGITHHLSDCQITAADSHLIANSPTWLAALVARVEALSTALTEAEQEARSSGDVSMADYIATLHHRATQPQAAADGGEVANGQG